MLNELRPAGRVARPLGTLPNHPAFLHGRFLRNRNGLIDVPARGLPAVTSLPTRRGHQKPSGFSFRRTELGFAVARWDATSPSWAIPAIESTPDAQGSQIQRVLNRIAGSSRRRKDETSSMKVRLIALSSVEHDRKLVLNGNPVVLGRCPEADLKVDDRWVSRRHCELAESDGVLVVRDLGSTHGTFVNGRQVTEARLRPEDKLTIGLTSFVADYRASARLARSV